MLRKLIIFLLIISIFSCKSFFEKVANRFEIVNYIRVLLTLGDEIKIKNSSGLVIKDFKTNQVLTFKNGIKEFNFKLFDNKTYLNNEEFTNTLTIYDKNNNFISINNRKYFGTLKIIPGKNSLSVINYLSLDLYLLSVVPSEVPASFEMEALKAQVVVARTYAYLFMKKYYKSREFDVDDTTRYQVYQGFNINLNDALILKLKKAIDETVNLIVSYNNEPILAYFHSNSGGKTISGSDYFGENSNMPYLVSVDDPYSLNYPGSSWNYEMLYSDFKNKLDIKSNLKKEEIIEDDDGFLIKIVLQDKIILPREIRRIFGYSQVRSERFKIKIIPDDDSVVFNGIGFGHGVGMSQWGAEGMAEKGFDFKEIISYYYPSTELQFIKNEE